MCVCLLVRPQGRTLHTGCRSRGRGAKRAPRISHIPPAAPPLFPAPHLPPPSLPRETGVGPRTPSVHPLRSAVPEKVKLGGTLCPTGTPTHHRDMAARSRAAEQGARITALGAAAGDGGTRPSRAPAETFFFPCGWRRGRRGGGPGRLTLRTPAHCGDSNSVQPWSPQRHAPQDREGKSRNLRDLEDRQHPEAATSPLLGLHRVACLRDTWGRRTPPTSTPTRRLAAWLLPSGVVLGV